MEGEIFLDKEDVKILREFSRLNGGKTTTWKIMRKIFPRGLEREHNRILRKIKKMANYGLFKEFINPREYSLIEENFLVNKIPKLNNFVSLKVNSKWFIMEN